MDLRIGPGVASLLLFFQGRNGGILLGDAGLPSDFVEGGLELRTEVISKFLKASQEGSSCCGSVEMNLTCVHEEVGSIPGLAQWVKDPVLP